MIHTSDELRQRIQLKKLENEMEMAQEEFRDKREKRQFTKEMAEQALKKIGESIAHAYVESQRASSIVSDQGGSLPMYGSGFSDMIGTPNSNLPTAPNHTDESDAIEHRVKVRTDGSGNRTVDCPTCGSPISYGENASNVSCSVCGMEYEISKPQKTNQDGSDYKTRTERTETQSESDIEKPTSDAGSVSKTNMVVPPVL